MTLVPLHVRSGYSLCRGTAMPAALVERAAELGHRALALTDVNGLCGAPVFARAAAGARVRPIIGAELRDDKTALVALVVDRTGYENLCRIITRLHGREVFDVPSAIGDAAGLQLITEDESLAEALIARGISAKNLWLGIDPPTQSRMHIRRLTDAANRLGAHLAATAAAMMIETTDMDAARVLAAIRLGRTAGQLSPEDLPHPKAVLRSAEQLQRELAEFPEAIANNRRIADSCRFDLLDCTPVFPAYRSPAGLTAQEHLRRLCEVGARRRYATVTPRVTERLRRELELIERKGFSEYFLVVRDIVRYARRRRAPTAGRGSGASSLVAYVLGITNVCPLKLRIPFERFLNEHREDFPDLDIDFCWRVRDEVIDYAFRRWGEDRVAMVCTHNTFQVRSAFRETAKAMGLSDAQISAVQRRREHNVDADLVDRIGRLARRLVGLPHLLSVHPGGIVIGRKPIDHYAPIQTAAKGVRITQYDKDGVEAVGLIKLDLLGNRSLSTIREACRWVNQIVQDSVPEASEVQPRMPTSRQVGMRAWHREKIDVKTISSDDPDSVPCPHRRRRSTELVEGQSRAEVGMSTSQEQTPPHHSAPEASEVQPCMPTRLVPEGLDVRAWHRGGMDLEKIPPDDPATFELLRSADTIGCNQLESPAMRHLLRAMRPETLRDIMQALALIRPGAAGVGMKDAFLRRRRGDETVPAGYAPVDALLRETCGVMLYEDDVMLVAAALLGTSLAEADRFRRAIQKCPDDRAREKLSREFLDRCKARGVDPAYAGRLWVEMAKFNAYSFCRAHAASYARLGVAAAYLKTHWPLAFWTAALNNNQSMYAPRVYVEQAKRGGVRFELPDVNRSGAEYTIDNGAIRVGLNRIDGLGPVGIERILSARRRWGLFGGVADLMDRARLSREEGRALILCGALDGTGDQGRSRPERMRRLRLWRPSRSGGGAALLAVEPVGGEALEDYSPRRKVLDQRRILGIDVGEHALAELRLALAGEVDADSRTLSGRVGQRVRLAGRLEAVRAVTARSGRRVRFYTFGDEWGLFEVTAFEDACRVAGTMNMDCSAAVVTGRVREQYDTVLIAAERISWPQR